MLQLSGSQVTAALLVGAVAGVIGFALSESDRRRRGRTPWGIPSFAWGLIWFASWIIGLVLFLIAHRALVRSAGPPPVGSPGVPPGTTVADFPAYPRPAGGVPAAAPVGSTPSLFPGGPGTVGFPPPAWHPDPSGRFRYRWWAGTEWTSYVSTDGHVWTDTSPDQRIGPY